MMHCRQARNLPKSLFSLQNWLAVMYGQRSLAVVHDECSGGRQRVGCSIVDGKPGESCLSAGGLHAGNNIFKWTADVVLDPCEVVDSFGSQALASLNHRKLSLMFVNTCSFGKSYLSWKRSEFYQIKF